MTQPITQETLALLENNPPHGMHCCDWEYAKLEQEIDADGTLCVRGTATVTVSIKVYTYRGREDTQWSVDAEHGELCK